MAQTTYQVIVSTDAKHPVIATSDDPVTARAALAWAKETYDAVANRYRLQHEQYKNGEQNGIRKEAVPTCLVVRQAEATKRYL